MKKLVPFGRVPLVLYALVLPLWALSCLWLFAGDRLAIAAGSPAQTAIPAEMMQLENGEFRDGAILCYNTDPQLIWQIPQGQRVRTVTLRAQYDLPHREIALYYLTDPTQQFSADRRVMPTQDPDGSFTFFLPAGKVYGLRLDPCSETAWVTEWSVEQAGAAPLWQYFRLDGVKAFWMLLLPALVACCANLFAEAWRVLFSKKAVST